MTRVLMITNRFIFGGIEKLLLDVFENRKDPDLQYDLLMLTTEKDPALIDRVKAAGVNCHSLELDRYGSLERQWHHYRALYRFLKEHRYDVVHVNITSYARVLDMLTIRLAGVPVRIIHSHSADEHDPLSRRIIRPLRKLYDYTATDFLACSDGAARHLFSKRICREKRYVVINNGIEVDQYRFSEADRAAVRDRLGVGDALLIGHVGRLTEAKNHGFLLEVFKALHEIRPDSRLLLVGDGELRQAIERRIAELGLGDSVILYGASADIPMLLSSMDVFLFPSVWEGLGISVIEAQCNGLPCYISANVPRTAMITSNVWQYDLSEGPERWARHILDAENKRVDEMEKIKQAHFDILDSVRQLEGIYAKKG